MWIPSIVVLLALAVGPRAPTAVPGPGVALRMQEGSMARGLAPPQRLHPMRRQI